MNRRSFVVSGGAYVASLAGLTAGDSEEDRFAKLQKDIDAVSPMAFGRYLKTGETDGLSALLQLESVFDRVVMEIKSADVRRHPAVWLVYNMGIVVKTEECCFSVDLMHRRGHELAPFLDFALITHNHSDHYTRDFYQAMDRAGKPVFSNFADNYGAYRGPGRFGGYSKRPQEHELHGVRINTGMADHNDYLVDFTTTYEISVGGWRIFHSGDCSNVDKLSPTSAPDLWIVHPRCGMDVRDGVRKFAPRKTVIAHLAELGHGKWRWSFQDGLNEKEKVQSVGGKAIVPTWGERIS